MARAVDEGAAPQNPLLAEANALWVDGIGRRRVVAVPILTPLQGVPKHIVQTPGIRFEGRHWRRKDVAVGPGERREERELIPSRLVGAIGPTFTVIRVG